MKAIVVAYDQHRGIGAANDLLWQRDLPADLAHFKALTTGGTVIMGRKTYESIGRPLPNRQNIVVTRGEVQIDEIEIAHSLEEAYSLAKHEVFVIGGGEIYAQALENMDKVFATEVQATFPEATVFFPALGIDWQEVEREHHDADEANAYAYDFVTYKRA